MSDAVRMRVIRTLTSRLRIAVEEDRSKDFINMLIDEIEKHIANLALKHNFQR